MLQVYMVWEGRVSEKQEEKSQGTACLKSSQQGAGEMTPGHPQGVQTFNRNTYTQINIKI